MNIDNDIETLLDSVSKGLHQIFTIVDDFLKNSAGYRNSLRQNPTVKKYSRCLMGDPKYGFALFMENNGVEFIEEIKLEHLERYKNELLNNLEVQTVRSYVTAVKQFIKYCISMDWIDPSLYLKYKLPKIKRKKEIRTVREEVTDLVLNREWGTNTFMIERNRLIVFLS